MTRSGSVRLSHGAALVCALVASLGLAFRSAAGLEAGDEAPQFSGRPLEGSEPISLSAHRGKVVYVDFWASWCPPCRRSLPLIDSLRTEFPSGSFQVLAVNVDRDPRDGRRFLEQHPVGYPSIADPEGRLPEAFGLETMPTSYLIDSRGIVRYVHRGFRKGDVKTLRREIGALLGATRGDTRRDAQGGDAR